MATIYEKLGATTRTEAIAVAVQLGEIPCPYCARLHRFSHRAVKNCKRRPAARFQRVSRRVRR